MTRSAHASAPSLLFTDDAFAYLGRSFESASSQHHAMLVCVALEGSYTFECEGTRIAECRGVVLGPDVAHRYDGRGAQVLTIFLDPESRRGRSLQGALAERACVPLDRALIEGEIATLADAKHRTERAAALDVILAKVSGDAPRTPLDRRIACALDALRVAPVSLADLAAKAALSESRFRHLFTSEVGLPFTRYLLQRRLQRAAEALAEGSTVAGAAHAAGFADEAHLSRTFRRTFGVRASEAFGMRVGTRA
jgi:AraC-like DNA-binding protein